MSTSLGGGSNINKFAEISERLDENSNAINILSATGGQVAENRFEYTIEPRGAFDKFYPVYFVMPSTTETTIEIYRDSNWNAWEEGLEGINGELIASTYIKLVGQGVTNGVNYPAVAGGKYLRTIVNKQILRHVVSNISFNGWASYDQFEEKGDNILNDFSSFHLRGALTYRIVTNQPIVFLRKNEGDIIIDTRFGDEHIVREIDENEIVMGDYYNDKGRSYVSYE